MRPSPHRHARSGRGDKLRSVHCGHLGPGGVRSPAQRGSAEAACSNEQDDNGSTGADCCVGPVEAVVR